MLQGRTRSPPRLLALFDVRLDKREIRGHILARCNPHFFVSLAPLITDQPSPRILPSLPFHTTFTQTGTGI